MKMLQKLRVKTGAILVIALVGFQVGICSLAVAASIDVEKTRTTLLLEKEPAGALTPTAAKAAIAQGPKEIVIAGRIAANGMDPFVKGKASFAMLQLPDDHGSQPGHNPDDCPFCKKKLAKAPMVAVQFIGADNNELPIDARELFAVENNAVVVIRGTASFNPKLALPIIQLKANGIYIRK
jgi:hypothetical protein